MDIHELDFIPLFNGLHEEQLNEISRFLVEKLYEKNQMILFADELETKFFVILDGNVKISRYTEEGREAIFAFLSAGDFFGEMALFENHYRNSSVMAIEDARILAIHRYDLLKVLNKYPQININLLCEMTQRIRRRNEHIKCLTLQNATGKVASTLLQFADDLGSLNLGRIELTKIPTHRDIANMVGTSRETISRAIKSLTKCGHISREGKKLVICDYHRFRANFS